jgi:hypothetical protein
MAASAEKAAALDASEASTAEYTVSSPSVLASPPKQVITPVRPPTAAKPAAVSVPTSVLAQSPPSPGGHRGLYMGLGALIVVAVLIAGGVYLPRHSKIEARQGEVRPTPSPVSPPSGGTPNSPQPEAAPAATISNPQAPNSSQQLPAVATPAVERSNSMQTNPAPSRPAAHPQKLTSASGTEREPVAPSQDADPGASPRETANSAIDRDEVEHQIDQLSNRAAAVNSSLDRLQQQQNSAGYGLRGDIVAKQGSMKTNLSRAESAEERGDLPQAKKYADMAASDVEVLEHFLGH